jgi:hypothetical protein
MPVAGLKRSERSLCGKRSAQHAKEEHMSTSQHVKPDPGVLERQHKRLHRWSGGKRLGAVAAAAMALVVIAALLVIQSREDAPATDQTPVAAEAPENTVNAKAVEVATGFLAAYGAFDVEKAKAYLADDATIASIGTGDDLRLLISWLEAVGYEQILDSCEQVGSSASGTIRCAFDFHSLRSGELGRGPFGGSSFDLVVSDGKIVRASQGWNVEEFSPQVWEPFANWVSTAHPKDAAVMYTDESYSNVRLTEASIRLWDLRTREYVEEVGR